MEFKLNPHSSKTMDDLKAEFAKEDRKREDAEKARRKEMERKQREYDRTHGFKTRHEIVKYLKDGNIIGDFHGLFGENSQDNNFLYWDVEEQVVKHHFQHSDDCDANFYMSTDNVSNEQLVEWLDRLNDRRTIDGFYPTAILHKNDGCVRKDVYEMFNLIDEILKHHKEK